MKQLLPFLTYNGQAEEAINWYHKAFPNSQITKLNRYGDASKEESDLILEGELKLGNQVIGFLDMSKDFPAPVSTWASTILIEVDNQEEFDQAFNTLKDSGTVMMHEKNYEKYTKVCWVTDKFGFTWQLLF
ncbi:VOC family protein [Enterococcus lactis]|uniref:VOC family protein n=1 Tax=Enterococcus lactis TaxID=357441 RepID=UPI002DB82D00|nr:VOC family protein [Enterococcus lactis]MEB7430008.1 VOC family protein [Enterococcus lactis]